jgi:galactitol-specific phosphotransferase system IIB component
MKKIIAILVVLFFLSSGVSAQMLYNSFTQETTGVWFYDELDVGWWKTLEFGEKLVFCGTAVGSYWMIQKYVIDVAKRLDGVDISKYTFMNVSADTVVTRIDLMIIATSMPDWVSVMQVLAVSMDYEFWVDDGVYLWEQRYRMWRDHPGKYVEFRL